MRMTTVGYQARDIRDRIFDLVGLARDRGPRIIDYSKPHKEVLMDVALRKFGVKNVVVLANQMAL